MPVATQYMNEAPTINKTNSVSELILVGLSYKKANIERREKLVVERSRLERVLAQLHSKNSLADRVPPSGGQLVPGTSPEAWHACSPEGAMRDPRGVLTGLTVLSTCNRVECYGSSFDSASAEIRFKEFFSQQCPGIEGFLYVMRNESVARHLFRVASGLDSMVVGEHQILGQVKDAYLKAQETDHTDKLINMLFQRALYAGKLVRSKTNISQGITSCGGAAAALVEQIFGKMDTVRIMLVGAGKMAESAAQHLLSRKAMSIIVSNRRREKAQELASQFGGIAMGLEEGMHRIHEMDVVITSTACPHYLVTKERGRQILEKRGGRPLILIDLSVPRNIDPDVESVEGIHLYNIDDLEAVIKQTLSKRQDDMHAAEEIVRQCCDEFAQSCICR